MKPVDQTKFGVPGGNCFSACVASILELPIDHVPYFMSVSDEPGERDGEGWFRAFNDWLAKRGLYSICTIVDRERPVPGLHILGGVTQRGERKGPHAVVACGDEIVHDPHPSRSGLVARDVLWVLVPLDPLAFGKYTIVEKLAPKEQTP